MESLKIQKDRKVENEMPSMFSTNVDTKATDGLQRQTETSNTGSQSLSDSISNPSGGQSLDTGARDFLEPKFGHSFENIKIHADGHADALSRNMNASAFTTGQDIFFRDGAYNPQTQGGMRLLSHELTHVVQQGQSNAVPTNSINLENDNAEREADMVSDQVFSGGSIPSISQTPQASIQRGPLDYLADRVGDALDIRDNEADNDAREEYQDAVEELAEFSSETYSTENFQSTTRLGAFDVTYTPSSGELLIVCKCKFNFQSGSATQYPTASTEDLTWNSIDTNETANWKANFLSTVSTTWSSGNHTFYCQKDYWEALSATTRVEIREVDSDEHFALDIAKIPVGAFRTSSVGRPETSWTGFTPGQGNFDSNDLTTVNKPGGQQQAAVHEAGHMLGLDDEYGTGTPDHSGLVESEFGHGVARGADGRIMSGGTDIQPEHGVTFLEGLKEATDMTEWSHSAKPPKAIPAVPGSTPPVGDFNVPPPNPNGTATV